MDDSLPIGLGTYESPDSVAGAEAVAYALERGYRHVDTSEMYGNEAAVGAGLERADVPREEVVVATKVAPENLAPDDVRAAARASMERLGVEYLDLLYVHWPDTTYEPAATLGAFDELREEGLVRHVGVANCTPALLQEAIDHLDAPLFAHQVECHVMLPQAGLRRLAREHDHHLVAYSPLAKGAVIDLEVLQDVAADHDATAAQVALAWLARQDAIVPIPKSERPAHIDENLAAMDLRLSEEDLSRIDAIDRTIRTVDGEGAPWR